jgi:cation-transporting ATPase 13A3/4/5
MIQRSRFGDIDRVRSKWYVCVLLIDYQQHRCRYFEFLTAIFYVISLGFVRLLFHWQPTWRIKFTTNRCALREATMILVWWVMLSDIDVVVVSVMSTMHGHCDVCLWSSRRRRLYCRALAATCSMWTNCDISHIANSNIFGILKSVDSHRSIRSIMMFVGSVSSTHWFTDSQVPISRYHQWTLSGSGLSDEDVRQRLFIYGRNLIDVKLKSIILLLFKEAITPFYIFQIFRWLLNHRL